MKLTKRLFGLLLVVIMMISFLPATIEAASKDVIPTKVRMYYSMDTNAITISLADMTQTIGNIKTDSKNLFAMLTGSDYNAQEGEYADQEGAENRYTIGLRSKKNGTYTVSFDILDKKNKKVETKKVKVYAYDNPMKSITFDGKEMKYNEISGKSAKVKVTLTSGNTIKKLEYGVNVLNEDSENSTYSEVVYKEFSNGGKVTFGTQPYYYLYQYSDIQEDYSYKQNHFNTDMEAPTYIRITYYDKYTKQNEVYTEYFYQPIE